MWRNLIPFFYFFAILAPLLFPIFLQAEQATTANQQTSDKWRYSLFNPTPRELMREMSTDRPDQTESPYTVDAGHFQLEMDLVNYSYERYDSDKTTDQRTQIWNVAPVNLKVGLLNNVDLQIIFDSYLLELTDDRTTKTKDQTSGHGDVTTRLKINVWGNDGGSTAFAVMPFVKVPCSSAQLGNDNIEGGIIFPLAIELPWGFGMGLMTQYDIVRNAFDDGYDVEFINTITVSRDLIGNLGGYVEFFSATSSAKETDWAGTVDVGFTYAVTKDVQLDLGCNFGVTREAPDFNPFIGVSLRY